jgi:hypothetical protein
MIDGRRRVFTPQNVRLMKRMAEQGCSASEIAMAIGSTPASVRVKCSHQAIRLKRGKGHVVQLSTLDHAVGVPVVAYLPEALYAEFKRQANDLRRPTSILASMLLSAVATNDLYKAVLDE